MAAARVEAIRKRFTGSFQGRGTELELVAASTRGFTHGLLRNYPGQGRRPAAGPTAPLGRHLDAVREAGQSAGSGRWSRCVCSSVVLFTFQSSRRCLGYYGYWYYLFRGIRKGQTVLERRKWSPWILIDDVN